MLPLALCSGGEFRRRRAWHSVRWPDFARCRLRRTDWRRPRLNPSGLRTSGFQCPPHRQPQCGHGRGFAPVRSGRIGKPTARRSRPASSTKIALKTGARIPLFALAELSYVAGDHIRHSIKPWDPRDPRDYYLGSAVYAWLFLFGLRTGTLHRSFWTVAFGRRVISTTTAWVWR